jgi:hypothetical protein
MTSTEHALVSFWKDAIDKTEETNLQESALSLQRQAETGVAEKKNTYLEAELQLRKIKIAAKDKPNFIAIVDANLAVEVAKTKYEKSLKVYLDMFGEEPKLLTFKKADAPAEKKEAAQA